MPLPFISTLGLAARAAYPIIKRGVREGLSSRALQTALRASGLGLRRQTLLDIMRAERGVERAASQLRFLSPTFRPNPARLPTAITKIRRQYSFTVEVRGTLMSTGETIVQNITIATDKLLRRQEMEAMATQVVEDNSDRYGVDIQQSVLVSGRRAGAAGTL